MEKYPRIVWLAAGFLALAACGGSALPQASEVSSTEVPKCELSAEGAPTAEGRVRAWVLFQVPDPHGTAALFGQDPEEDGETLLTEGGGDYVIVRADVVEGDADYNLVVPVDAAGEDQFQKTQDRLTGVIGVAPARVLRVGEHFPTPPHCSHTFVSSEEYEAFSLPEYFPPGRHPQSPGANPWG